MSVCGKILHLTLIAYADYMGEVETE